MAPSTFTISSTTAAIAAFVFAFVFVVLVVVLLTQVGRTNELLSALVGRGPLRPAPPSRVGAARFDGTGAARFDGT
jgi:hypothetical protein